MGHNPKREQRKKSVKPYYNNAAYNKPTLKQNHNVVFERKANEKWIHGKIVDYPHNQTYIVQSQAGTTYRRNRLHSRPTKIEALAISPQYEWKAREIHPWGKQ